MDQQAEIAIVRRAYAKQILAAARIDDPRLEMAFGAVPRENFLGPGPWEMFRMPNMYVPSPDSDPAHVYVDQVIGLNSERGINNGQPSLHAMLLAAARIKAGDHVVHVGAGTGYYSAIMAHLAGPTGRVTAIEFNPELAGRARKCLSYMSNVKLLEGDGASLPFDAAEVIYVNAGVTHPAETWLDGLSDGGRLILPLTTDDNFQSLSRLPFDPMRAMRSGAFFRIQRRGAEFDARWLLPTAIIPAESARDPAAETALTTAFANGGWNAVTRLVRDEVVPTEKCWVRGPRWCLAYD
jgi:protein-L-isoaspartate(D-aspartate) O-methyltransferase